MNARIRSAKCARTLIVGQHVRGGVGWAENKKRGHPTHSDVRDAADVRANYALVRNKNRHNVRKEWKTNGNVVDTRGFCGCGFVCWFEMSPSGSHKHTHEHFQFDKRRGRSGESERQDIDPV